MIAIINYGLGNIKAFANVYTRLNIPFKIVETPDELVSAEKFILPGVGAFDRAMERLNASGMREALAEQVIDKQKPVIGICVGMQMLADSSEEGTLPGLGWITGTVRKFDASKLKYRPHLPHMGWNNITPSSNDQLFVKLENDPRFYFLHSYYFDCEKEENVIATAEYGDKFACVVRNGNIYGVQFHPEKSHHNGVNILKNFGNLGE